MFYLFLLSAFANPPTNYPPLAHIVWPSCASNQYMVPHGNMGHIVRYTYCSSQGFIGTKTMHNYLLEASYKIFMFIDTLGLIDRTCRGNLNLEVYEIDTATLNDHTLFTRWQAANPSVQSIWALYDPRTEEVNVSSLMITHHGNWDRLNVAHEMAHYWFDRLCMRSQYNQSTEDFAKSFETYFLQN